MKKLVTAFLAASALTLAAANIADARELRVAPAAPPPHPANGVMYTNFMKYLPEESEGRLTATMLGPEVVNLGQMKDALQSQIAEDPLEANALADLERRFGRRHRDCAIALVGEILHGGGSQDGEAIDAAVPKPDRQPVACQRVLRIVLTYLV